MEKLNSQLTKLRKIGVFGGAFDPIHLGHLLPVKELQDKYRLDHVVFVPTGIPNSTKNIIATSEQRLKMLTMALEDYDFKIDTREITTEKTSYTFDTITSIKNDYKNTEIYLIIGFDTLLSLSKWRKYMELLDVCNILVTRRENMELDKAFDLLPTQLSNKITDDYSVSKAKSYGNIILENTKQYDIASSDIRLRLKEGRDISGLVNKGLEQWLVTSKIY